MTTDQELQKIAEKITNTVSDNDGRLAFSKIVDSVSFQLRQVRDAQEQELKRLKDESASWEKQADQFATTGAKVIEEVIELKEKLRIARAAMYILKNQGNVHGEDCGIWLSDCNDDEYESPIHNSCTCGLKELHETINEALEKMGVE